MKRSFRNPKKYQGGWITAAIAGGASLLGGLMSNKSNAKEAAIDREWQRENAQNAHQYQVADMRAAGLNPVLSATGGTGARASGGSQATQTDAISPAVNSAREAMRVRQELDNMKANEKLTSQQEKTSKEQQHNYFQDTDLKAHQSGQVQAATATEMARTLTELEKAKTEVTLQKYHQASANSARATAAQTDQTTRSAKVEADLDEKMRHIERTIKAAEGGTSAIRNIIPSIPRGRR